MAPRKRRRATAAEAPAASPATLPEDLVLEIVARSDASTLVRCAAASKRLRREILAPSFTRRVTDRQHGIMPRSLVAFLHTTHNAEEEGSAAAAAVPLISLVNPATPAAASFLDRHLSPFMSRGAANLLANYEPVASRGGLVLLHRRRYFSIDKRPWRLPDYLCVYDPMTGDRTFLSGPPDISKRWFFLTYVLLNAADDIGCTFKVLVFEVIYRQDNRCNIRVQAATSSNAAAGGGGSWGPVTYNRDIDLPSGMMVEDRRYAVLLRGGAIHFYWLNWHGNEILAYDIHAGRLDTVKLPPTPTDSKASQRCLQASPDWRLRLLVADGFVISVWLLQLQGAGWTLEVVIDAKENLRSLDLEIPLKHVQVKFQEYIRGARSSVVLLEICHCNNNLPGVVIVLDLETKEMRRQELASPWLMEIHSFTCYLAYK